MSWHLQIGRHKNDGITLRGCDGEFLLVFWVVNHTVWWKGEGREGWGTRRLRSGTSAEHNIKTRQDVRSILWFSYLKPSLYFSFILGSDWDWIMLFFCMRLPEGNAHCTYASLSVWLKDHTFAATTANQKWKQNKASTAYPPHTHFSWSVVDVLQNIWSSLEGFEMTAWAVMLGKKNSHF